MTEMEAFVRSSEDHRRSDSSRPRSPRRQGYDDGRGAREMFSNPRNSSNPWSNIGDKRRADSNHNSGRDHRNSGEHKNFWREHGQKHSGSKTYSRTDKSRKRRDSGQYRDRNYHGPQGRVKDERDDFSVFPNPDSPRDNGPRRSYDRYTPSRVRSPPPVQRKESTVKEEPGCPPGLLTQHAADPPESREVRNENQAKRKTGERIREGEDTRMADEPVLNERVGGSHQVKELEAKWGSEKERLESGLKALAAALTEKSSKIDALEKERDEGVARTGDAERVWDRQREELEGKIADLAATLAQKESALEAWEKKTAEVKENDEEREWRGRKIEMEGRIRALESTLSQKIASIEVLERTNDDISKRASEWERRSRDGKEVNQKLQDTLELQCSEIKSLRQKSGSLQKALGQTKSLLDVRTEENKVAQAFMTTADQYSLTDLMRMVEHLNDEVFQCAVDMSDAVLDQQSSQLAFTPEQDAAWKPTFDKACEAIVEMWSADIVSQLRTEVAKGDTILFECLVQNVLVAHCEDIVGTFSPERPELDRYMKGLWKEVMDSQPTPIAKNWLSITNSALKKQSHDSEHTTKCLGNMLTAVGWRRLSELPSDLEEAVGGKLADIVEKATKIKAAVREGILSSHVEVFSMAPNRSFNPGTMQDAYAVPGKGTGEGSDGGPIVCTTGLGVCCRARKPTSTADAEWKLEMFMKPKVLLRSTVLS